MHTEIRKTEGRYRLFSHATSFIWNHLPSISWNLFHEICFMKFVSWNLFHEICFMKFVSWNLFHEICFMKFVSWNLFHEICFMKFVSWNLFHEICFMKFVSWDLFHEICFKWHPMTTSNVHVTEPQELMHTFFFMSQMLSTLVLWNNIYFYGMHVACISMNLVQSSMLLTCWWRRSDRHR